ncbi:zinc finger, CCHC-type containing protein [Tanacetum coccineum]
MDAAMKHMASNFSKLDKFKGVDFIRWQKKMHFLFSNMSVVYVLTTPIPKDGGDDATVEQIRKRVKWDNDDYDSLEAKYMAEDASSKKFLVSCIIDKLPPSWKDFKHILKHLKEELTLVELGSHLRIKESLRVQDSDKPKGNNVTRPSVVNMVEHNNSSRYNDNKGKRKHHDNIKADPNRKSKVTCWKCGKPRHLKKDCKGGKVGNKANGSGTKGLVDGSTNSLKGATVHACKDRCWFNTYESLNDVYILHMGNESTALVYGRGCVDLRPIRRIHQGRYGLSVHALTIDHKRKQDQYAVSREDQYAVLEIWNEYNILEDIKRGPYSKKSLIRHACSYHILKLWLAFKITCSCLNGVDEDLSKSSKVLPMKDLYCFMNVCTIKVIIGSLFGHNKVLGWIFLLKSVLGQLCTARLITGAYFLDDVIYYCSLVSGCAARFLSFTDACSYHILKLWLAFKITCSCLNGVDEDLSKSSKDMAPLPPREQRHPFLRYQCLEYTDSDIADFEERLERIYSREIHRFQLGGAKRRLSWRQFILALGLHTGEEMESLDFARYWSESERMIPRKGDLHDYWRDISTNGDFLEPPPSYTLIRDSSITLNVLANITMILRGTLENSFVKTVMFTRFEMECVLTRLLIDSLGSRLD